MGTVEVWLDLLLPEEASMFPADIIALPPAMKFEVRVVVWKAKNVVSFDYFTGMNDMFVKVSARTSASERPKVVCATFAKTGLEALA